MLERSSYDRLANLERQGDEIRSQFSYLLRSRDTLAADNAKNFSTLEIADHTAEGYIRAEYQGITIRFYLYLGYDQQNRPKGKVVCVHRYPLHTEVSSDVLGVFAFDQLGQTDIGCGANGAVYTMAGHADHIVLMYLDKAAQSTHSVQMNLGL